MDLRGMRVNFVQTAGVYTALVDWRCENVQLEKKINLWNSIFYFQFTLPDTDTGCSGTPAASGPPPSPNGPLSANPLLPSPQLVRPAPYTPSGP